MTNGDSTLYKELAASVGPMATLPNNGASYHTGEQIITHLNRVLGPANWSFRVIEIGEEADSDECWAFGEITATISGTTVVKQDYGSQAFKKSRATGKYVSKWDDKKSAATDALKRCARLLGVGLDAWAKESAPSWHPDLDDAAMAEQARNGGNKPAPKPQAHAAPLGKVTPIREGATTPPAGAASPSSSTTDTNASAGDEPLKTKVQLVEQMNRGLKMAASLGLEFAPQDPANMDRVAIQDVIAELARQIKIVKAAKAEAAS